MAKKSSSALSPRGWFTGHDERGLIETEPEFTALQSVPGMSSSSMVAAPTSNATPMLSMSLMSMALWYYLEPRGTVW